MAAGDRATARAATLFLFERQQLPDGSMPRNSLVNGKTAPDSFGTQLDETAYPILMAHQLGLTDASLYENHIKPAANFVASRGPAFGVERWEEQSGFSPSTIAAEIAGLVAAADLARHQRRRGVGGGLARRRRRLPALDQGLDGHDHRPARGSRTSSASRRPATRTRRSRTTSATAARRSTSARSSTPASSSSSRLGVLRRRRPGRPRHSLAVVDATIKCDDRQRARLAPLQRRRLRRRRRATAGPWAPSGQGTGHLWPALAAERAEQLLQLGDGGRQPRPAPRRMDRFASGFGLIPEQNWEQPDLARIAVRHRPDTSRRSASSTAKPAGSAVAAHLVGRVVRAACRRLAQTGVVLDRPANARPALHRPHAGPDHADGHEPGGQLAVGRLAGHGHRHDRARQPGRRARDQHRRELGHHRVPRRPPPPTARSASTSP